MTDYIALVKRWPADLRYLFEERSAIGEFSGNMARQDAEQQAYEEVLREHGAELKVLERRRA